MSDSLPVTTKRPRNNCSHDRSRYRCRLCQGSGICSHDKVRSSCASCKLLIKCSHRVIRANCITCMSVTICRHKLRRCRCQLCRGTALCPHIKEVDDCLDCALGNSEALENFGLFENGGQSALDGFQFDGFGTFDEGLSAGAAV